MEKLVLRELQVIETLLKNRTKTQTTYNKSWHSIGIKLDIPIENWREKKQLKVDSELRELLREMAKVDSGYDLLLETIDGNRLDVSRNNSNEKLSKVAPEQDYVLIRFLGIDLHLSSFFTPKDSMRLTIDSAIKFIKQYKVEQIFIVENLDVFDQWQLENIAQSEQPSLLIFNGSTTQYSAKGVYALCSALPTYCIYVFGDFDPAGIQIAAKIPNIKGIIVPQLPEGLLEIDNINHIQDFFEQDKQVKFLRNNQWQNWQFIIDFILKYQLSIKQQHLLTHAIPLQILIKNNMA